jgi:drug/metabolite transporter (DMT)-like permease
LSRLRAFLLLALVNALWGSSHVVAKVALEHYDPWLLAALRMSVASVFLWLFQLRNGLSCVDATGVPRSHVGGMLAIGMFGVTLEMLLWHYGLHLSSSTNSSLLVVGEVLFTAFAATVMFRERLGRARTAAALVGVLGVLILVGGDDILTTRAIGDVLILLSTFVEGFYTVLGARLARRYPAHVVLTWTTTGGMLIWLLLCMQHAGHGALLVESWQTFGGVLYLAVVSSVICYVVWFHVLGRIGANAGAPMLVLQPLTGVLLSVTLLGEPLWVSRILGGLVILAALSLNAFATVKSPSIPGPASADVPDEQ